MSYAQRKDGAIIGLYGLLQPGFAEELIEDTSEEVIAFMTPIQTTDKREIAIDALLAKTAAAADAPQEIKDWANAKNSIGTTTLAGAHSG